MKFAVEIDGKRFECEASKSEMRKIAQDVADWTWDVLPRDRDLLIGVEMKAFDVWYDNVCDSLDD